MYTKKWMQAQKLARKHVFKAQEKQKFYYNLGTVETMYEIGDWVMLKAPPMAGKFINRWNGPYKITKSYSKVNYEIENIEDKKQKRIIVHVNRLKKFKQREGNTTVKNPNILQPQKITTENHPPEEKQTTARRGRGRPRKNLPQTSEDQLSKTDQNFRTHLNPRTKDQSTQTRNQSRQLRQPRPRSSRQNQANNFHNNPPPWRGRLRSSSSSSQNHLHYCLCPRCQPLRSRAPYQADNNYRPTYRFRTYRLETPPQFLPRHLAIGRRDPCFPNDIPTEQFCINHPNCTHNRQHMIDHYRMRYNDREPPFHSRYNLRPRN
jgi:ribosomal protein L21E